MRLVLIAICALSLSISTRAVAQDTWQNLDQPAYKFSYPANWVLDEAGQMGTKFIIFSALESAEDTFKENVNLIIQDLTGYNLNLDQYAKLSEEQIKNMMNNVSIGEHKRVDTGSSPHYKIIYSGDQGIYKLTFEQYYFVKDNKAYVLTLTTEQKSFEKFKAEGEKMLESFVLK
jgi:hypothetical protein